jgi:hypothetical protein
MIAINIKYKIIVVESSLYSSFPVIITGIFIFYTKSVDGRKQKW